VDPVKPTTPVKPEKDGGKEGAENYYGADGSWQGSGYNAGDATKDYGKVHTDSFKEADKAGKIKGGKGEGGGGGGDKVICTALHSMGMLPDDIYILDTQFGQKVNKEDPMLGDGYRLWATPVAEYIKGKSAGSKIALAVVAPLAKAWAQEMAHTMEPENYKSSIFGKTIMAIGHPTCRAIGNIFLKGNQYQ
jgi:hypothetical protein